MRRTFKYGYGVMLGLALVTVPTGCKKILNPEPIGAQTVDATFKDFNGSMNAVNGLYSALTTGGLYRGSNTLLNIDQASDDVMNESAISSAAYNVIDYFELVPDNATTFNLMDEFYRIIFRANLIIERVPKISFPQAFRNNGTGRSFNDQFVGEAHFIRAFSYYNLVRIFGGVPLRTTEIEGPKQVNIARSSVAEVYAQIENDLKAAAEKLPLSYTGSGAGNERGRVTRWSALTVLAEAYLTQRKFTEARATALQVIQNNSGLRLNNTYAANFFPMNGGNKNTQESLFEIQFNALGASPNSTAATGNNFTWIMGPAMGGANNNLAWYRPTDNLAQDNEPGFTGGLIQEYEAGDLRRDANFLQGLRGNGITGWLTNKYYEPGRGSAGNGNYVVYRMADVFLIYAEATNELGGPEAQAIEYVNQLRRRAFGLPLMGASAQDLPAGLTQATFRELIRSERRKELAMENKRWFDLVRYGFDYANARLKVNQKRERFNQSKMLFPFPQVEIINNPLLTQNPGY